MTWVGSLAIGVAAITIITALTGYFVSQEFAFMTVDRSKLSVRADEGDASARRALKVTKRTSFMLSGAQLGITITGLIVGYVAEPLVGAAIGDALGGVGLSRGLGLAIGVTFALVFSTVIQMVFGELVPKNLAIARPEPIARALARSTQIYLTAMGWLISLFDAASNALLRLFHIEPVHDVEHAATVRDLEHIVAESRTTGELSEDLSLLLARVLDFPERDVEHAMIPRTRVDHVSEGDTLAQIRQKMAQGHSRYPVLNDLDEVVGVVVLTDLLATDAPEDAPTWTWRREPLFLPTVMPLPDAVTAMRNSGAHLACVIDEYGGFAGILTFEDLAEELVGEIIDEHDEQAITVTPVGERSWRLEGDMHLDEIELTIGHDLPETNKETIAGLVIETAGTLPDPGQVVDIELPGDPSDLATNDTLTRRMLRARVLEVAHHVPSLVEVTVVTDPEAA